MVEGAHENDLEAKRAGSEPKSTNHLRTETQTCHGEGRHRLILHSNYEDKTAAYHTDKDSLLDQTLVKVF